MHGRPTIYFSLRIFGCNAYAHIPKENWKKLDPKAQKCVLVGYQRGTKGYRLWNHETGKLVINRDVFFNESRSLKKGESKAPMADKGKSPLPKMVKGEIIREVIYNMPPEEPPDAEEELFPHVREEAREQEVIGVRPVEEPEEQPAQVEQPEASHRRSSRVSHAPERYGTWYPSDQVDLDKVSVEDSGEALFVEEGVPSSYKEAMSGKDKLK